MNQGTFEEKMQHVKLLTYHAKMAAMSLPRGGVCIVDDETAIMDRQYFDQLATYDISLPTGTYFGKRWKRDASVRLEYDCQVRYGEPRWMMGEFYDLGSDKEIGIRWRRIIVEEGKENDGHRESS